MTRYSVTITQSYDVTLDGEEDEAAVRDLARKVIARYANPSGVVGDGRRWHATTQDPEIAVGVVEAAESALAMASEAASVFDAEPEMAPGIDAELDIF